MAPVCLSSPGVFDDYSSSASIVKTLLTRREVGLDSWAP